MSAKKFFLMLTLTFSISVSSMAQLGMESFGRASFYAESFYGQITSNGEKLTKVQFTAAHRTLPFGTMVEVTNLESGKQVIVRINDRGPFRKSRIIDLTVGPAKALGIMKDGLCKVKVRVVGMDGSVQLSPDAVAIGSGVKDRNSLLAQANAPRRLSN
jgi:rare lipoprotein A